MCQSFGNAIAHIFVYFCARFGQVLGRLAGAWCDSGQADDSVDSLMHGHTMWQSRHGWKREAAPSNQAPSPTPIGLQKLTATRKNFSLRTLAVPGLTARLSTRLEKFVHEWVWEAAVREEFVELTGRRQVGGLGSGRQREGRCSRGRSTRFSTHSNDGTNDGRRICFSFLSMTSPV